MKIIRFLDEQGESHYGAQHNDDSVTRIEGCIFSDYTDTGEAVTVTKRLAPVKPAAVLCIGLNTADMPRRAVRTSRSTRCCS